MAKKVLWFLLIVAVIYALGDFVFQNRDMLGESPRAKDFPFENLSKAVSDADGNVYFIDKSLARIVKADHAGNLKYMIQMNQDRSSYVLLKDLAVDSRGYMYAMRMVMDPTGILLNAEDIVRYTPEGRFDGTIFRHDYPADNRPTRPGRFSELRIRDGNIYFYDIQGNDIVLHEIPLGGGSEQQVFQVKLPDDTYLSEISGLQLNAVAYTTKRAEVYKIDEQGNSVKLLVSGSQPELEGAFPVSLDVDAHNQVYFSDIGRREIVRFDPSERKADGSFVLHTVLTQQQLDASGHQVSLTQAKSVNIAADGSVIVAAQNSVVRVKADGTLDFVLDRANYPLGKRMFHWAVWASCAAAALLLLYALRFLYKDIMKKRVSIIVKQIIVFVPLIVVSLVVVAAIVYINFSNRLEQEVFNKLKLTTHVGAQMLDVDRILKITKPGDFMDADYKAVDEQHRFMLQGNPDLNESTLYSTIYRVIDNRVYVLMYYNTSVGTLYPIDSIPQYRDVIEKGDIVEVESHEADGEWMYTVGPLKDKQGDIIGMHEVGMPKKSFDEYKNQLFWRIGKGILIITPIIVIVFLLMTFYLLSSIRTLRKSVTEISQGNWDAVVDIHSGDEVADLGDRFNFMSAHIRNYIEEIKELSQSYYRFVPQQFLGILKKDSILDVHLGDQAQSEMIVLVSNIRSFYLVSKKLTPKENFDLINSYLNRIGPVIRNHNGMINNYLGAGILALFPQKPEEALNAAVEMRMQLHEWNSARKKAGNEPIEIGIGLHRGPLMLGIIGEEQRLDGSVISDDVTMTSELEKISETLGASILLTETIVASLPAKSSFQYRDLGKIQMNGKDAPVRLFDLYQGDPEPIRKVKQQTKKRFEEAVSFYQEGRFFDAREAFLQVIKANRRDNAAKMYFYLCDEYFQRGTAEGWNGTLPVA